MFPLRDEAERWLWTWVIISPVTVQGLENLGSFTRGGKKTPDAANAGNKRQKQNEESKRAKWEDDKESKEKGAEKLDNN